MKLTIKQHAENIGISVQSVYAQIKRGSLKCVEENGIKYVVLEEKSIKPEIEDISKKHLKIINSLLKENRKLRKELEACHAKKDAVLDKFLGLALEAPKKKTVEPEEAFEAEFEESEKKSGKSKKKKGKKHGKRK